MVVNHGARAEAFLVEGQTRIELAPFILVGVAEVEPLAGGLGVLDGPLQQQVEGGAAPALLVGRHVLQVHDRRRLEKHQAADEAP